MKYLSDYTNDAMSTLFEKTGTFFAFSQEQFEDQAKEKAKYVSCGNGMYCQSEHIETLKTEYPTIIKNARELDLKENGESAIIRRELFNHECFYTNDIEEVVERLEPYGISEESILNKFKEIRSKEDV